MTSTQAKTVYATLILLIVMALAPSASADGGTGCEGTTVDLSGGSCIGGNGVPGADGDSGEDGEDGTNGGSGCKGFVISLYGCIGGDGGDGGDGGGGIPNGGNGGNGGDGGIGCDDGSIVIGISPCHGGDGGCGGNGGDGADGGDGDGGLGGAGEKGTCTSASMSFPKWCLGNAPVAVLVGDLTHADGCENEDCSGLTVIAFRGGSCESDSGPGCDGVTFIIQSPESCTGSEGEPGCRGVTMIDVSSAGSCVGGLFAIMTQGLALPVLP